jgi:hypothetical protein
MLPVTGDKRDKHTAQAGHAVLSEDVGLDPRNVDYEPVTNLAALAAAFRDLIRDALINQPAGAGCTRPPALTRRGLRLTAPSAPTKV